MPDPAASCPECAGPQLVGHPAGLVYRHDTRGGCSLQRKEDARVVADQSLAWPYQRPATDTERVLLAAAGHVLPDDAVTQVTWLSAGVRRRTWPALEGEH